MAEPIKKLTKFTERELLDRKVGTFIDPEGLYEKVTQYRTKRETYEGEGILKTYHALVRSFQAILETGIRTVGCDKYASAKCSQIMIDAYLLRGSRGEESVLPGGVFLHKAKQVTKEKSGIELYDASDFEDKPACGENEKVRWVFENMRMAGIEPSDAPSQGAFILLMELRDNAQARQKFYESSWLKLLQKEDADKVGKLEDTGKDTIELVDRLIAALPDEVNP